MTLDFGQSRKQKRKHRRSLPDRRESLAERPTVEWLSILQTLDIPSARISTLDEVFNDPHLAAVGMFKTATHPTEGDIIMTQLPFRFSDTQASIKRMQPKFGEHSMEVLRETGLSESDVQSLFESGCSVDGGAGAKPQTK